MEHTFKNFMTWSGMNPLTIRIMGTGEYVTKELANLERTWVEAQFTNEEEIRQDEEMARDNFYDR